MTNKYSPFASGQNCIAIGGSEKQAYKAPSIKFMISCDGVLLTEENKNYDPATVIDLTNYKDFPKFKTKEKVSIYEISIPDQFDKEFVSHFASQKFISAVNKYKNSYEISHLQKIYNQGISICPSSSYNCTGSTGPSYFSANPDYFGKNECHYCSNFTSINMKDYKYYDNLVLKKQELYQYIDSIDISELLQEKEKYENLLVSSSRIFQYLYSEMWKSELSVIESNIKLYYSKVEELEQLHDTITDMKNAMSDFIDRLKYLILQNCKDKDVSKIEIFYI